MDWILKHKILAIALTLVFAGVVWYFLSGSASSEPVLSTDQPASVPSGAADMVASLLALRTVSLDGTIFSNPSFRALKDFTTPVVPEPVGRPDPFAPLGAGGQVSAGATKSAQIFVPTR